MLLKSVAVSIPLSLTQCMTQSIHNHHFSTITPTEVFLNVALASSVYGNDRRSENTTSLENSLICLSTLGSISYFATDTYTLPFSFLTAYLIYEYKNVKKEIASFKPFFVSFFWVLCTYFQPLFIRHDLSYETSFVISLFLIVSSLSHIADIPDIKEDEYNNINTPAVLLGKEKSYIFAYSLLIVSLLTHETHGNDLAYIFYDICFLFQIHTKQQQGYS